MTETAPNKKIAEALIPMLNNPLLSDVRLYFKMENKTLYAHKLLLIAKSRVFKSILTGPMATSKGSIEICECKSDEFLELLRFCYTDQIQLKSANVNGIIAAANYYDIVGLEDCCCEFVMAYLNWENVCSIYEANHMFTNKLTEACLRIFEDSMGRIVKQNNFSELSEAPLLTILAKDMLSIGEFDLFLAVHRTGLGSKLKLLQLIRYPNMTEAELDQCAQCNESILTPESIAVVKKYIETGNSAVQLTFSTVKRQNYIYSDWIIQNANDVREVLDFRTSNVEKTINFTVTEKIVILSFVFFHYEVFGSLDIYEDLELVNHGIELTVFNGATVFEATTTGRRVSCEDGLTLMPNVHYTLKTYAAWDMPSVAKYCARNAGYCVLQIGKHGVDNASKDELEDDGIPIKIELSPNGQMTFVKIISFKVLRDFSGCQSSDSSDTSNNSNASDSHMSEE